MNDRKSDQNKQVESEHYYKNYDTKRRWISYWHQIEEVLELNPSTVLEIGVGNKTVSDYLKKHDLDVTTVDIDPELDPDVICDVRNLSDEFNNNSFDVVLCAEVLEHVPFEDFEDALKEIKKVAKDSVILTLPNWGVPFELNLKIPKISRLDVSLRLPFPVKHEFNGEHYWDIGKKNFSLSLP